MLSRRRFLKTTSALALLTPVLGHGAGRHYPFTLGVASGAPAPDGAVLWTRLAPEPLNGGGMPAGTVEVRYRVCSDEAMRNTVIDDVVSTSDEKAHSVHVSLKGLRPGRDYWYQFYLGDDESPVGRTRTTDPSAPSARFALASCQAWETGYYPAYADMAEWAPDCVFHVGDYIYEGGASAPGVRTFSNGREYQVVRSHNSAEITSLWDYRNRYALYRTDPQLQAAHAASPWLVSMDDHEVDNNWAGLVPQDPHKQTELEFRVRRMAAFKAWYEHMPVAYPPTLIGLDSKLQMYGSWRFGPAQVCMLDTRQYRSDQVCGDGFPGEQACGHRDDPTRSMTGEAQERWLMEQLARSDAPFNVLAQQTWFAPYRYNDGQLYNMDQWDGYTAQRQRLLERFKTLSNPIVLSGDWHCAQASSLHLEPENPRSQRVGHEFASTSISSLCSWADRVHGSKENNPHVKYVNGHQRGYARFTVTEKNWKSEFRVVNDPLRQDSTLRTDFEFNTSDS
ncbi:alkaline phosphatase D family protein [Parahaliea mediterranea]|uniref:Alkaline phosphatase D family protein n=1 Tax=Parahaliea mediterranea TaxID=651086 RepID=A0A939DEM0_9GAMM|nr:alkaline phosphatase D family protein [Parahaliea mediterranea]MBN7796481.1 alkaline phosphatase D family protein [Parahaliea mediterranea]